ncbi:UNVERIFIED_CONTAM: Retrovirus-related Pol polyprotein from transposon TNT 1-94 [Sesamum radiatum]|uniref:Retrovirus-related Pol polyprotein from transposon TNT 1-94 n=1 Tax=Sesamum radiatum TaxID=300843 RepID=A0AAW2QHC2_SESRA
MAALSIQEPNHYLQAKGKIEWENDMKVELPALNKNDTWEVVDLPKGKRAIRSKWVFKLKLKPNGTMDRYKARLVAKGYNLVEEEDYIKQFSVVAKAVTVHILLVVASSCSNKLLDSGIRGSLLSSLLMDFLSRIMSIAYSLNTLQQDLGLAKYFLGLEIARYATDAWWVSTLLKLYQARYNFWCPAAQSVCSRTMSSSYGRRTHLVPYLKGNPDKGLFFPVSNSSTLPAFCNTDWLDALIRGVLCLGIAYSWVMPRSLGSLRNSQQWLDPPPKLNIEV